MTPIEEQRVSGWRQCIALLALLSFSGLAYSGFSSSYVPAEIGPWKYKSGACTDWIPISKECEDILGGEHTSNSEPCWNPSRPVPWYVESHIEPAVSDWFNGATAHFEGWASPGQPVYCLGFFDTREYDEVLGIEAHNFGLITVDGEPGEGGARRDRLVRCPIGSDNNGTVCERDQVIDPYKQCKGCGNVTGHSTTL